MTSRRQTIQSLLILSTLGRTDAHAEPTRPVTIVIAYPTGGPADLMARTVSEVMAVHRAGPVVVDSRPGGGGQIAAAAVLSAPADGHHLLLGDMATLGTNRFMYRNFRYDPLVDLEAVAPLLLMPMVLWVPQASPYASLSALVEASKTKPLAYASQGGGSTGHLLGEMLRASTAGQFVHVPYKGSAPAMTDLLGEHVDFLFDGIGPGLPHLRSQRLRALAVAGPQRLAQIPDVATTAEQGVADVALSIWFGMAVRAGTPRAIVRKLHDEIEETMQRPAVVKRFGDLGFEPMSMGFEQFGRFLKTESDRWAVVIKRLGITVD